MMENTTQSIGIPEKLTSSSNGSSQGSDLDFHYYELAEKVFVYYDPILTIGGLLGNILSFLVMQRKAIRTSPVPIFLAALAIADSLVLILDFINNWFKFALEVYILGYDGFCQFHRWIFLVLFTYSAWLVTAVSCERLIVVWFPFKARTICTKKSAMITVTVMPFVLGLVYINSLWGWHISEDGLCDVTPSQTYFQYYITPWLSAVLYSYAPALIICITNIGIVCKLNRAKERRKSIAAAEESKVKDQTTYQITMTVIATCTAYLLTTVPLSIWYIVLLAAGEFIQHGPKMAFIETIILIIGLSNHAINFLLYVLTSSNFRNELLIMLYIRKPRRPSAAFNNLAHSVKKTSSENQRRSDSSESGNSSDKTHSDDGSVSKA